MYNFYHIIKAKMEVEAVEIFNDNTLLYSYNYKTNDFYDANNKKLKLPITNIDEFTILLKSILEKNIDNSLSFENNKLKYKITNYNEVIELYELDKYIAKNYSYDSIVEFITNSSNETIIDYIENVDDLKYEYCELSKTNYKPIQLLDIIFYYNQNINLISYIFEHKNNPEYFFFNSLLKLFVAIKFDDMVNLTLKYTTFNIFNYLNLLLSVKDNVTTNQEKIIQDDANLFFNYEKKYEMFSHFLINAPCIYTPDIYTYLNGHIYYLRNTTQNTEMYNAINYIKNTNLISMMYDKNLNMVITNKIIDFNNIYFLKTNNMKIVEKCKNLVYLEYEGDNIDGISNVEHILSFYVFKNCKINYELLTHLFSIHKNISIDFVFQNCTIDKCIIDKLKSIENIDNGFIDKRKPIQGIDVGIQII